MDGRACSYTGEVNLTPGSILALPHVPLRRAAAAAPAPTLHPGLFPRLEPKTPRGDSAAQAGSRKNDPKHTYIPAAFQQHL